MKRFLQTIGSAWAWLAIAIVIILWFPTMLLVYAVTVPFDRGRYVIGWWFRRLGVTMALVNPYWRFSRTGIRVADPRRPYVVVSNHESFADILLICHLPFEMKWLSKVEILGIPFIGWMMQMAGDIPLKRGFGPSAVEAMERCRTSLRNRVSVIFFPEGTRSVDDKMLPFKDGAFRLAIDAGVPILPLAVSGAATALRKHDWRFGRSVAEVRVLEPVETTGLARADIPALRDRIWQMIATERDQMRNAQRVVAASP
jgi:1-acyl-sn-glycerol-3-phosphate acyltransferase